MTTKKTRTKTTAVRTLTQAGVPLDVAWAARDAAVKHDVPLARLIAVAEAESGFRNVWGHDSGKWREPGEVTKLGVVRYFSVPAALRPNGAGVWQLTWPEYQDRAQAAGGLHDVYSQASVAATVLKGLPGSGSTAAGISRYNGSGPAAQAYGRRVHIREAHWQSVLDHGRQA